MLLLQGCYPPRIEVTGKNLLQCDIGNPMPAKTKVNILINLIIMMTNCYYAFLFQSNFVIHLKPKTIVDHAASTFLFLANVSSSNNETKATFANNNVQLSIPVRVEVHLTASG
jgi:hypothetical protein